MRVQCTRRELLAGFGGLTLACGASPQPSFGLNLYTVREPLDAEPERVLRELAAVGCRYVEGRLTQVENHLPLLAELEMPWVSWMIDTPLVTGGWDAWDQVMARGGRSLTRTTLDETIEIAVRHGVQNVGISYTLPAEREGPDGWRRVAEQCNRAGEACKKAGLRFYFHNHAEEFVGEPGARPFDVLLELLNPELVRFEIDVFWVSIAGAHPVAAIRRAAGRLLSLHLKDKAAGVENVTTAFAAPRDGFKEVGKGTLDWPAILRAAREAGVERYFVEQDYAPGDPLASVRQSFDYLRSISR
jgi:sugar phosphate isomerase/epimerase